MPDHKRVLVRVWGKEALFQRAEIKKDKCSYSMITPSAARGILDSIYWHPGLIWKVDKIYVINPIRYAADKVTLRDVEYIIEAHFIMSKYANDSDNPGKFKDIFMRKLRRKTPYKPICFGTQKYPAEFEEFTGSINQITSYYRNSMKDLGIMFYDFDYSNGNDEPMFFHAILKYGVLSLENVKILR